MNEEIIKLGKLEIDLEELTNFIVKAKKKGYGSGEYIKAKDGSKIFTFQEGNYHYTDNYDGSYQAPGDELVRWQKEDGQRIWQMSYSGGMLPEFWKDRELAKQTFGFLKKALSHISLEKPFRGPGGYECEDFLYRNWVEGNIKRFNGKEEIYFKNFENLVFSQDYIGGLVVPK